MRTLLCAIPALLALAGMASAEPQQLDEAQLGGVAAGQGFSVSTSEFNNTSTALSTTNSVAETVNQSLGGVSSNSNYATGLNSSNVTATGSAFTGVTGTILP
jgi:formylmethanofuran dehydrogenase subunit B